MRNRSDIQVFRSQEVAGPPGRQRRAACGAGRVAYGPGPGGARRGELVRSPELRGDPPTPADDGEGPPYAYSLTTEVYSGLAFYDPRCPRQVQLHLPPMTPVVKYYSTGVYSSRRIAKRLHEDVAFRVLAAGNTPDFRKRHLEALGGLFEQVLKLT